MYTCCGVHLVESTLIMPYYGLTTYSFIIFSLPRILLCGLLSLIIAGCFVFAFISLSQPIQCLFFSATFPAEVCARAAIMLIYYYKEISKLRLLNLVPSFVSNNDLLVY